MQENIVDILIRIITSVAGIIIVTITVKNNIINNIGTKLADCIIYCGRHFLELYVVHIIFTSVIKLNYMPCLNSIEGLFIYLINLSLMIISSILIITMISSNKWSKLLAFGKK